MERMAYRNYASLVLPTWGGKWRLDFNAYTVVVIVEPRQLLLQAKLCAILWEPRLAHRPGFVVTQRFALHRGLDLPP